MTAVNAKVFDFKLITGYSAETSGGLFVCLPKDKAQPFIQELKELDGEESWIIGDVLHGTRTATIAANVRILEV